MDNSVNNRLLGCDSAVGAVNGGRPSLPVRAPSKDSISAKELLQTFASTRGLSYLGMALYVTTNDFISATVIHKSDTRPAPVRLPRTGVNPQRLIINTASRDSADGKSRIECPTSDSLFYKHGTPSCPFHLDGGQKWFFDLAVLLISYSQSLK